MDAGTIDAASQFVYGLIALMILITIVLAFYSQLKKLRKESAEKIKEAVEKAKKEAAEETRSTLAFNELKKAVERVDSRLENIDEKLNNKVTRIEEVLQKYSAEVFEVKAMARRANKRIDLHKKYDHGFDHVEYREEDINGEES